MVVVVVVFLHIITEQGKSYLLLSLLFLSCLVLPYRAGSHVVSHNAEAT